MDGVLLAATLPLTVIAEVHPPLVEHNKSEVQNDCAGQVVFGEGSLRTASFSPDGNLTSSLILVTSPAVVHRASIAVPPGVS